MCVEHFPTKRLGIMICLLSNKRKPIDITRMGVIVLPFFVTSFTDESGKTCTEY